jgi:hypothetical protein
LYYIIYSEGVYFPGRERILAVNFYGLSKKYITFVSSVKSYNTNPMGTFTEYIKPVEIKNTEKKPMIGSVVYERTAPHGIESEQKPVPPVEETTILGSNKEPEKKVDITV